MSMYWSRDFCRFPAVVSLLFALSGCTMFGSLEQRAESVNLSSSAYNSAAVLYNVLRASEAEPLNFVSLVGVSGHEGSTIGVGLPTIIVGPGRTPAQNLFLFGPNSVGHSASNDFNVNVVDDPTSFAALLKPVDMATLGFFLRQGYSTDHIFFLFISKIVSVDRKTGQVVQSYENEPYGYMEMSDNCQTVDNYGLNCHWRDKFYTRLNGLIKRGLSIEVESGFVPTSDAGGKARFCFDKTVNSPGLQYDGIISKNDSSCRPGLISDKPIGRKSSTSPKSVQPAPSETTLVFVDPAHLDQDVYVYTRSVYGSYRFLGELVALSKQGGFSELPRDDQLFRPGVATDVRRQLINLTHDRFGCWTSVDYANDHWCVPKDAINTKRTFQILSQLFRLFVLPSKQPATPTVRTIGG